MTSADVIEEPAFLVAQRQEAANYEVAALHAPSGQLVDERLALGGEFVFDQLDGVPALWGGGDEVLWSAGEALWIVGPSGVGKTTLVGQLVRARLGLSDSVLGWPVEAGAGRVLYLAMDRPRQIARSLRRHFDESERTVLDDRLRVWKGPPPADIARHPDTLTNLAEQAGATTVVIDSAKDAAIGLVDDEVGAGFNRAVQTALVRDIEILCCHHQRKGQGTAPRNLEDVYGSTWLIAGAGSVILLWGAAGDLIVDLQHLKQPAATIGPLKVEHDHHTGTSMRWRGFDLLSFMRNRRSGVTALEVAKAATEKDSPNDNAVKKAKRSLERLILDGHAHRTDAALGGPGGSTAARYHLIERHSEQAR